MKLATVLAAHFGATRLMAILLVAVAGVMGGYWFGVLVRGPSDRRTALDSFRGGDSLPLQPLTYRDEDGRFRE